MWYKRTIPLILVFLMGVVAFAQNYIPHPSSERVLKEVTAAALIIAGFGLFIGAYSLLHMHVTRMRKRQPGWAYSALVFVGAASMIFLGLWNNGVGPLRDAPDTEITWFNWAYMNVQIPCSATLFSILAFFMASAAFRTFRARNLSAALLLIAALTVMFGQVPISEVVGKWFGDPTVFNRFGNMLMTFPNTAAKRGVMLGVSLGMIAQSLRVIFGIERSYLGGGE